MKLGETQQFASPEEALIHISTKSIDHRTKPGTPEELVHYGVKGMRWGVRKQEETSDRGAAGSSEGAKSSRVTNLEMPNFEERVARLSRTDSPQTLTPPSPSRSEGGRVERVETQKAPQEKEGWSREQKIALTFGVAGAAAAGYVAYRHFSGEKLPGFELEKLRQETQKLDDMKLPSSWDVKGLKDGPISAQRLGDLTGGEFNAKLTDPDSLVINTARGYADILPKNGFSNPYAVEQHASVTRVLEEMRDKYPAIRNMNIEVVPMSRVPGMGMNAHMSVLTMRAGEARIMYNDKMDAPSDAMIRMNRNFLPGLGQKDYVAYHEMGHLLAAASGDLPPAFNLLKSDASYSAMRTYQKAEPLLHKKRFLKHGFTFKELSKLSRYAASEPAEAMAELAGHYHHPEMRKRLTPDQMERAKAMFDEMGGLT